MQKLSRLARVFRFSQNTAPQCDRGVRAKSYIVAIGLYRLHFCPRNAIAIGHRQLTFQRRFINVGCTDGIGLHAKLGQQVQPPWAARS